MIKNTLGLLALMLVVALCGVYFTDALEKYSINYRTAESTEVHRVLGNPYVHLGDNVPASKVKLGSVFYVHNNYIKMDTCHVFVSNVYWGVDNHISHHYSMFTNWFSAAKVEADEVFIASDFLPPGRYRIVKKSVSVCSGKEHYSTNFSVEVEFVR